jgi:hypothetical protein
MKTNSNLARDGIQQRLSKIKQRATRKFYIPLINNKNSKKINN